jgi:hypothetical protein
LTWVERRFGHAIAQGYAGHTGGGSDTGATSTYVRASVHEMATALAALTGEPHPLTTAEWEWPWPPYRWPRKRTVPVPQAAKARRLTLLQSEDHKRGKITA